MARWGRHGAVAVAVAVAMGVGCAKPAQAPGVADLERARELEARAEVDERRTREKLFDEARVRYARACEAGLPAACAAHRTLDATLRERRGECDGVESCREQGARWVPDWRGEQRLSDLCWGRRIDVVHSPAPPVAPPDGESCQALGDAYVAAGRHEDAATAYLQGCRVAHYAPACRGAGHQAATLGSGLSARAEKFDRGCQLDDAPSCVALGRAAVALHEELLGNDDALTTAIADGTATRILDQAKAAAQRGCELGDDEGCRLVERVAEMLAAVDAKARSGCVFAGGCGKGELCNVRTGACEGPRSKGAFFDAYERGVRAFEAGKLAAAKIAFESAREMVPTAAGPWRWLGLVAERQRRWADCVTAFDEALRLNPRSRHAPAMQQLRDQCAATAAR